MSAAATNEPSTLTIGIPTFNRAEVAGRRVEALLAAGAAEWAEILIVDDASSDATQETLSRVCEGTPARVLRNAENRGYAGSFLRLFAECRTEYLLVGSDDDAVAVSSLATLKRMLAERSPAFVSAQFRTGAKLYRGQRRTGPIEAGELFPASAHAPGLVYRVAACSEAALPKLSAHLEGGSAAAGVYPQVLVLACLLLAGESCLWWDGCTAEGAEWEPTGLRDRGGAPYYHLAPRWQQTLDMLDFLADAKRSATRPAAADEMAEKVEGRLFWSLRSAIEHERPALVGPFDRSAARFYARRWRWDRLRCKLPQPRKRSRR